jgi:hypothetical protein
MCPQIGAAPARLPALTHQAACLGTWDGTDHFGKVGGKAVGHCVGLKVIADIHEQGIIRVPRLGRHHALSDQRCPAAECVSGKAAMSSVTFCPPSLLRFPNRTSRDLECSSVRTRSCPCLAHRSADLVLGPSRPGRSRGLSEVLALLQAM